jgi:prepilin-type N-terminal cleavage/methylation domain-containing protein
MGKNRGFRQVGAGFGHPRPNAALKGRQAGFTLLELMVALVLTALLTLVAYGSLSLSLKAVRRGQAATERLQELRVGQSILERSLSSTVPGTLGNQHYFAGDPGQIKFFTLVPLEAHSLGGIYHWRIYLKQEASGQVDLAVEQTRNVNWYRDPEGVEVRQTILHHLTSVHFAYGRGTEEVQTWEAKRDAGLPDWVKVYLTQSDHQSQVLLIPIHVSEFIPPTKAP